LAELMLMIGKKESHPDPGQGIHWSSVWNTRPNFELLSENWLIKISCRYCALLSAQELAQLLKRVDAEIANCESCHHDENEKRKKYKV